MSDKYRIGGWATDDPSKIIVLYSKVGVAVNRHSVFFRGDSAYQTTSGKAFYAAKISFTTKSITSATNVWMLGYADSNFGDGFDETTASLTNLVSVLGDNNTTDVGMTWNPAPTTYSSGLNMDENQRRMLDENMVIPIVPLSTPGKFIWQKYGGGSGGLFCTILGFEI